MKIENFTENWFGEIKTFKNIEDKFSGGQVTVVGGSSLFHGAPIMSLKAASRIVSMVYFATPDEDKEVADKIKASIQAFVWVPYDDLDGYVGKSNAVLIGPGMMRSRVREHGFVCDEQGMQTRKLAMELFEKHPSKKWIVDGGALQVMTVDEMPKGAIITPNSKEFEMLFGVKMPQTLEDRAMLVYELANKHNLVVVVKDDASMVSDGKRVVVINGGSDGLIKGGVGDVTAGIILGFLAKDDPVIAVAVASYLVKRAGNHLTNERGLMFSAQDLVDQVPLEYGKVLREL